MLKIGRIILGILMILIGLPGLVFPIIPGTVFIVAGILILSVDVPLIDRLVLWVGRRYPKLGRTLEKFRAKLKERNGQEQ
jgi:uncharacterized protein YqgC (DUF456 family)